MFVLNYTTHIQKNDGSVIIVPQGTEMRPTSRKLLWRKNSSGKLTAVYYIADPMGIAGNSDNWWQVSGSSWDSHHITRIARNQLAEWKATRLDTILRKG